MGRPGLWVARHGSAAPHGAAVPGLGTTYVALPGTNGNYASTPDSAANSITSDIDIRMKLSMANWSAVQGFACKYVDSTGQSWRFYGAGGQIQLDLSANGSADTGALSSVATGFTNGTTNWVRATWRNSDNVVKFYTSAGAGAPTWVQLGTDKSINLAGIFNSTSAVVLGSVVSGGNSLMLNGHVYYFELRDGIDGTIVNSVDFSAVTPAGTRDPSTVVGSAGETWTVNGAGWDWNA